VDGELFAVVDNAEVGVLDVDGDGLAGVGAPDPKLLASDHHGAVVGDAPLGADGADWWRRDRVAAATRAPRSFALWSAVMGDGRVLARTPSQTTWAR